MRRLCLAFVLLAAGGFGQPSSLIQQAFANVSVATASAALNNLGQIGHSAYLTFSNAPGHTCTTPAGSAQLEYSFDNSTWNPFGSPQSSLSASTGQAYIGQGAFAYVRFNLLSFDTTNCRATGWYAGTSQPLAVQLNGPVGSTAALVVCDQSATVKINGAANATLVSKPSSGAIHVCSIQVQGATGTIEVGYGSTTGNGCLGSSAGGTGTEIIPANSVTAGLTPFGNSTLGQLYFVPTGNYLCANISTASSSTFTTFYTIY